jgi:hypothetical protein
MLRSACGRADFFGQGSGVAIATIATPGLWFVVFVYSGDKDPAWTVANIAGFTIPGLIVYPATWYVVIFRARDYSLSRTMRLVVSTFAAGAAVVGVVLMVGGLYVAISTIMFVPQPWKALPLLIIGPFAYAIMTALGIVILIVPYMIVAMPLALLHRWLLLAVFGTSGLASASMRSRIPVVPSR